MPTSFSTRSWSSATLRFARDVAVSVAAAGIGALAFSCLLRHSDPAPAHVESKLTDRLSFVQEDVPVRETRIYDTLAMFAEPQAEPGAWSDMPAPLVKTAAAAPAPVRTGPGQVPRMVAVPRTVEAPRMVAVPRLVDAAQHPGVLPPARPLQIAQVPVAVPGARPAGETQPVARPSREPIRVFGWSVPGTQVLPTRRDAVRTVALIGDTAAQIGNGTVDVVGGTASSVGHTVSSLGGSVAETIGWQ